MSLILLYSTYGHNGIVWSVNIHWIPIINNYTGELTALSLLLIFHFGYLGVLEIVWLSLYSVQSEQRVKSVNIQKQLALSAFRAESILTQIIH